MESLPPSGLTRKNILIRALLGDRFFLNLSTISDSNICQKFITNIRSREHTVQDVISCRVINHWEALGLIECERNNDSGWRKFNLIEYVWLHVVQKLREIGLALAKIAEIKAFYFEKDAETDEITHVDYYLTAARIFRQPVFFVVLLNDNQAEFLDYREFQAALNHKLLGSYICINLNDLLNTFFVKKVEPIYRTIAASSPHRDQALDLLVGEDYDIATIYKKDKNIQKVELDKYFDEKTTDYEIFEDYEDVDIIKKKRKGEIVMKKRKVIKNLTP